MRYLGRGVVVASVSSTVRHLLALGSACQMRIQQSLQAGMPRKHGHQPDDVAEVLVGTGQAALTTTCVALHQHRFMSSGRCSTHEPRQPAHGLCINSLYIMLALHSAGYVGSSSRTEARVRRSLRTLSLEKIL